MSEALKPVDLTVVDTNTAAWEDFPVPAIDAVRSTHRSSTTPTPG
jgi:hypothetical protein